MRKDEAGSGELRAPGGEVRLFVGTDLGPAVELHLAEAQHHYIAHVMRAKPGESVRLFNGRDGEWRAGIVGLTRRTVTLVCEAPTAPQVPGPDLWLLFAPIKRGPIDYLVEKATELGVAVLQPVITRRTIVARVNLERLAAHAVEAAEQSGRLTVPELRPPVGLAAALDAWPAGRRLMFCDEGGGAAPAAQALAGADPGSWAVLTGPEGGFAPEERVRLRAHPAVLPVTLGPRIMRADTAALAALAVWQSLRGDWR